MKILISYLREPSLVINKLGGEQVVWEPVGCVVATSPTNLGWSECAKSKGDRFNKKKGKEIAIARAQYITYNGPEDHNMFNENRKPTTKRLTNFEWVAERLHKRALKYFGKMETA